MRIPFKTLILLAPVGLLPLSPLSGQDETAGSEQAEVTQDEAFEAMGYFMAQRFGISTNYSEEEIDAILSGVRAAIEGEEEPEDFVQKLSQARTLFMQRVETEKQQQLQANRQEAEEFLAGIDEDPEVQKSDTGLRYVIKEEGDPEKQPAPTDRVKVNYVGKLADGTVFDSTEERGQPATFPVGGVVKGFSEGLQLIGEGGSIRLYIPSDLGYGENPRPGGAIEPGDLLIFDVELVEVLAQPERPTGPPPGFTPPPLPEGLEPPPLPSNLKPPPGPPPGVKPKQQQQEDTEQ